MNRSDLLDVIVVGGGPCGAIVARGIAEKGFKVSILEEHETIGEPSHCAGLISVTGFSELGVESSKDLVLNKVKGAKIFSPSGYNLTVERQNEQAYVVDRASLDRRLISHATEFGAQLLLTAKAKSIQVQSSAAYVVADVGGTRSAKTEKTFSAKMVVSAEGSQSKLTKYLGLDAPNPKMKLYATQFEMSNARFDREDLVYIYLGKGYAPGFFTWVIPTGSDSARVGLASKVPKAYSLLRHFVSHSRLVAGQLGKARINKILGGNVLTGGPIRKTYADRFLSVGDCAGQTKPTTGGGVITGGVCARIASKVVLESLLSNDFSERFLKKYERIWRGQLGQEFLTMLWLRRFLNSLPDVLMDRLIHAASRAGLTSMMEERGDIDLQSQLIKAVLRSPKTAISLILSFLGIL